MGGGSAAELVGGLGLFLLGGRWIASGAGELLGPVSRRLTARATGSVRSVGSGAALAGLLVGSGDPPDVARRMAAAARLPSERAGLFMAGASLGPLLALPLVLLALLGDLLLSAASFLLLGAVLAPLVRRSWEPAGRALAGWSLTAMGIALMTSAWEVLATPSAFYLGTRTIPGALLVAGVAGGAAWFTRSPIAIGCLALQGTLAGALHGSAGIAMAAGAVLGSLGDSPRIARRSTGEERSAASLHVAFCVLWGGLLLTLLMSLTDVAGVLSDLPGGPVVAVSLVLLATAAAAAGTTVVLAGPIDHLVRSRSPAAPAEPVRGRSGSTEMLADEMRGLLEGPMIGVAQLANEVLGLRSSTPAAREEVCSAAATARSTIAELQLRHTADRASIRVGSQVQAALRAAEALEAAADQVAFYSIPAPTGVAELDLSMARGRLAVVRLAELARDGEAPEAWSAHAENVWNQLEQLWRGAVAAASSADLGPVQLDALRTEIVQLHALIRALDDYTCEVSVLVGGPAKAETPEVEPALPAEPRGTEVEAAAATATSGEWRPA